MFKVISILFLLALTIFIVIYERIHTRKVIQRKLKDEDYGLTRTFFSGSVGLGIPASDKRKHSSKLEADDKLSESKEKLKN